ncbi:MAG: hypothetical protein HUU16_09895 [Candidatus Omnitrophica bacterium]|nr:hypothetical protein [Candidatus Omnitrophota bacterium]
MPTSINSDGVVVGHYGVKSSTDEITHPFLWTHESGMKNLGFAVGQEGNAKGVNDAGRILIHELLEQGDCMCPDPENSIYLIRSVTSGEVIRTITASTRIEECMLGPDDTVVLQTEALSEERLETFRWSPLLGFERIGGATDIINVLAVNPLSWIAGHVVQWGKSRNALYYGTRPFLWTPEEGMTQFDFVKYKISSIVALNNLGQALIDDGASYYILDAGSVERIPGTDSNDFTAASMNNVGEIVGTGFIDTLKSILGELIQTYAFRNPWFLRKTYAWTSDWSSRETYAAIWFNGGLHSLDESLVNGREWRLERANDINDKGQIIGVGKYKGKDAGFILDPVE